MRRFRSALAAVLLCAAAPAYATTVTWDGDNNFNDDSITFAAFKANQLTDISGSGLYEAARSPGRYESGITSFDLLIRWSPTKYGDTQWIDILSWTSTGDNKQFSLDALLNSPNVISFTTGWISGIKLVSSPNGESNDPNFTNFKFTSYMTREEYYRQNQYKYKDWDDFIRCGDYEDYIKHTTKFVFNYFDPPPPPEQNPVPLPGALPLMASVLGGGYLLGRLRRRRKA